MTKFITIEGNEGVGKSTALQFIDTYLTGKGISHVLTREPGGTPFAEEIRNLLVKQGDEAVDYKTELLLFFAARSQHIEALIKPTLAKGEWVISDRFTDSTYAYQGAGRGFPEKDIAILEEWVQNALSPDLTILLDAPVDVTLKRIKRRGELDRIENEQAAFFERIRACYLERAKQYRDRYVIVNACVSLEEVQEQLRAILENLCKRM